MARITLIPETQLSFSPMSDFDAYQTAFNPAPFVPNAGEKYEVIWDGVTFSSMAYTQGEFPGTIFLGNTIMFNGVNTGEPFLYGCLMSGEGAELFTFTSEETHTVAVYQETEAEEGEVDSEAIILKNREGIDIAYSGIDTVKFNKADGGTQTFIRGEVVEDMPIEVDFSKGNQIIGAPVGILVKSAILQKPENLIPQNIVKGVDIAGVVGTKDIPTGEATTVNLDFSSGDMSVLPDGDKLFSKVDIPKPQNLTSENIALGIDIAGVVGTLAVEEGGGSGDGVDEIPVYEPEWIDDICFWDCDGTLIQHIPVSAAASLTILPEVPEHEGLTFVGWNYTLEELQAVTYPRDVGAVYVPSDGKTHVKINITQTNYLAVPLYFQQTVSGGVSIDWGDGSDAETVSGTGSVTVTHTYAGIGEYEIVLTVTSGVLTLGQGTSATKFIGGSQSYYPQYVTEMYIGENVNLSVYSLSSYTNVKVITLPLHLTSIPNYNFYITYPLCIVIPRGITTIGSNTINSVGSYANQYHLPICLPETINTINSNSLFRSTYSYRIVIPGRLTTINANVGAECEKGVRLFFPSTVVSFGDGALSNWPRLRMIDVSNVKTYGTYAFQNMYSLKKIKLSEKATTIGNYFGYCCQAEEIILPATLTTIGSNFLYNAYNVKRLIIKGTFSSRPSISGKVQTMIYTSTTPNAVMYLPSYSTDMYVPDSAVEIYKSKVGDYKKCVKPLSEYPGKLPE